MDDQRAAPEAFSAAELEGARKLRIRLADSLPPEFDSDFFLARWWRAYKGEEKALEHKLNELIEHRKAFGYNEKNILEKCATLAVSRHTFERFAISQLQTDVFSDNVAVFLQKMEGCELKELIKVMPLSHVLHSYFLLHECFQRTMRKRELETGKPGAVAVVLDLQGLNLSEFINPLSNQSKLARLVVKIWSDYFSENMIRLYLVHPPGLLSLMWQIAKHIVDAKTQSRIAFIQKTEELQKYLDASAIPVEFGGTRRDDSGHCAVPESCVQKPLKVLPEHYFDRTVWWKLHGMTCAPELKSISIKPKAVHEVALEVRAGQRLLWEYTTSSDLTFEIVRVIAKADSPSSLKENCDGRDSSADEEVLWPRITVTSLKVPEHGVLEAVHTGDYILRWGFPGGGWLSAKLHCIALAR